MLGRGLEVVLGSWLWMALLEQGLGKVTCRGPVQPQLVSCPTVCTVLCVQRR